MSDIIFVHCKDKILQTTRSTLSKNKILSEKIIKDKLVLDLPSETVLIILNYLRTLYLPSNIENIRSILQEYHILEKNTFIDINIGGIIYTVDKDLLVCNLKYFENFFNYHIVTDYSNLLIDRCPELFAEVLAFIKNPNNYEITDQLKLELDYYQYNHDLSFDEFLDISKIKIINFNINHNDPKIPIKYRYGMQKNDLKFNVIHTDLYTIYEKINNVEKISVLIFVVDDIKYIKDIGININFASYQYYLNYDHLLTLGIVSIDKKNGLICLYLEKIKSGFYSIYISNDIIIKNVIPFAEKDSLYCNNILYKLVDKSGPLFNFTYKIKYKEDNKFIFTVDEILNDINAKFPAINLGKYYKYTTKGNNEFCAHKKINCIFDIKLKVKNSEDNDIYRVDLLEDKTLIASSSVKKENDYYLINFMENKNIGAEYHLDCDFKMSFIVYTFNPKIKICVHYKYFTTATSINEPESIKEKIETETS
ncbi:BTB family protein [Acanthamoeba polyphaga moumouvirus]|uniref:BTB family protein n=1 Tax=Acanthamoeba polyphaga moumouvirus TaxID=1269028 RepID=L7RDH7_9VIRU|nr:BTB family protein [Acanthamoeba polyphaga moumouvirus]AGC02407.1 BTB family protein [Acanthamoeba polyphaga moumouvirus]